MKKWFLPTFASSIILSLTLQAALAAPPGQRSDFDPTPTLSKSTVQELIKAQGKEKDYYFDGLSFEEINLDQDLETEIVAKIDGAVHLGNFFVFDHQGGKYKLIAERAWKVEQTALRYQSEDGTQRFFETVERTGGTGIDMTISHVWQVEKGVFEEAFEWTTKTRSYIPFSGNVDFTVGGYQFIDEPSLHLYAWTSNHLLTSEAHAPTAHSPSNRMVIYSFDGRKFVESQDQPYSTLIGFLQARIQHNDVSLIRTSSEKLAHPESGLKGAANPHFLHYTVEQEFQTGNEWTYQVLLFSGNADEATQVTREKITVSQIKDKWYVTMVEPVEKKEIGKMSVSGSDPESLQQVAKFLDAQVKRDWNQMATFFSNPNDPMLTSTETKQSLIGVSNPHWETFDIIKAETVGDTIRYTVALNMAVTDQGINGSQEEIITLKKVQGIYQITDIKI
ncbi:hypothetical protein [Brevibacillus sp. SYSU BS000544]|uniref:hypothetical protein n=1 Tax=Brevibacillus sp. SYSU BS000544 TaxID=3416443 RepID=UPI003CE5B1E9